MNHNFYKRAICLLLASSVTFGPAVGPLSAHALEELSTQMADQMAELTPAQSSSSVPMMELTPAQSTESETPEKTEDAVDKEEKPQDSAEQNEQPQDSAQQDEQSKLPEQESPVFTGKNLAQEQEVEVSASHTAQGSDAEHARDGAVLYGQPRRRTDRLLSPMIFRKSVRSRACMYSGSLPIPSRSTL